MKPTLDWKAILALGAVTLVFAYLAKKEAAKAVTTVEKAVNPVSDQNVFYKAISSLTPTGDLGTSIYDVLHPGG